MNVNINAAAALAVIVPIIAVPIVYELNESLKRVREGEFANFEQEIASRPGRGHMEDGCVKRRNNILPFNMDWIDRQLRDIRLCMEAT